jgi:TolB protein
MHSTHIITTLGLGVAFLVAGCGGSGDGPAGQEKDAAAVRNPGVTEPPNADVPGPAELPAGRIAFRRYLDDAQNHGAVFTINPDGTGEKQITDPPAGYVDDQPDWSPDGKRIAFERCNEDSCQSFTVAADGGRPRRVPAHCKLKPICDVGSPSWLPDGRIVVGIAQGRVRVRGESDQIQRFSVDLIDLARRTQRTIVKRTGWHGDTHMPAASPDGRRVVYMRWNSWRSKPADGRALFVVGIDGSGHHRVTPWALSAGDHPGFSPDGSKILFRSFDGQEDTKQSDYWTVHPDGSALTQLTHFPEGTLVLSASYSLDGGSIVHATDGVDGNADIFVMRADGSGNRPVTRSKLWDSAPDWGPAGS